MYGQDTTGSLPILNKELILSKTNSLSLMRAYLAKDIEIHSGFVAPEWLRMAQMSKPDRSPSCSVYVNNKGECILKDWATGLKADVFDIVKLRFACDFNQALIKIAEDFGINYYGRKSESQKKFELDPSEIEYSKEYSDIRYKLRSFNHFDRNYWLSFGIPLEILRTLNIFCISHLWVNGQLTYVYRQHDPAYLYDFKNFNKGKVKIYFPFRKKARFITNVAGRDFLEGMDTLDRFGKKIVITKSYKDVAFIRSLKIQSVSPSSETVLISEQLMENIHSRFGMTYVLFDNDEQGEKMSEVYKSTYPFIHQIFIPKNLAKDITDLSKRKGRKYAESLLDEILTV